jgi:quercetin dioxygenase-like cupin family protein
MYQIENQIANIEYKGLTVKKLASKKGCETVLIAIEKGHAIPDHTSPRDTLLVMLEGVIHFHINGKEYALEKFQSFNFPAKEIHKVLAITDSKLLIIR